VLMLIAGVVLTRRALRPVSRIALAAEAIEPANLSERLPVLGNDEFAQLNTTFNTMLSRLQNAFDEKEEALRRQKRFTSDASHELRTPLTAIRARTGIALSNPPDPEELVEHVVAINRATDLMIGVVQDLLLLAASDEGRLQLRKERCLMSELIEDALASVDASKHEVRLNFEGIGEVNCDPSAITRVLVNLLQNSIAHTPGGKEIQVSCEGSVDRAVITVTDQGCGIPREHLALIFDRFHRVDSSRDRSSGGTGLGLAIAKAIVEAHAGTIELFSDLGHGTVAVIVIPS